MGKQEEKEEEDNLQGVASTVGRRRDARLARA